MQAWKHSLISRPLPISIQPEQIPNSILIRNHELALSSDRAPGIIKLPSLVATHEAI